MYSKWWGNINSRHNIFSKLLAESTTVGKCTNKIW